MNPQTWWYLSRASGIVAMVLLAASLVLGVLLATRVLKPLDRPAWLLALHRWVSALAVVGTVVHLMALVADNYVHFGWKELLVPGASTWQPGAVTVGIVAFYLLVLVQVTSLMMKRLPKRLWRGVHLCSYAMLWAAVVHGAMAGTDASNQVYQFVALLLSIVATSAALVRVLVGRNATRRTRSTGAATTGCTSDTVPVQPG